MEKSEFIKRYRTNLNDDLQFFERKCGCEVKRPIFSEKDIVKKSAINSTNSCDNCHKAFLYQALPYFEFKCDCCGKVRILCINENSAKELAETNHKDDNGNDCNGKISFNRLQNFEFNCYSWSEPKIWYVTEEEAKKYKIHNNGDISYRKLSAEYVMLTFWDHHWDKLEYFRHNKNRTKDKKQTSYTLPSILDNILVEVLKKEGSPDKIPTIFLKRRNEYSPVVNVAWKGYVYDFHKRIGEYNSDDKERIHFKVDIQERIYVPEEYAHYRDGWYRFIK